MGGDMVVALAGATGNRGTLFGHNSRRPLRETCGLHRSVGRCYAREEKTNTQYLALPQVGQTVTVVGLRSVGAWGYDHGVNEHGVAIGCTALTTRLHGEAIGLVGPDLVRLGLERSRTARQAFDVIVDLIARHGQGHAAGECTGPAPDGSAFLIVDGREAFAVESAGRHWAMQEVRSVRALTDVATIRQDWDGIARGLASEAIKNGWWADDGSKLDFAAALAPDGIPGSALRRWGRATLLLEEQHGHLDAAFLRRVLGDHYEGCDDEADPLEPGEGPAPLCMHGQTAWQPATVAGLVAHLPSDGRPPIVWYAPGPPCLSAYLPVLVAGELPREMCMSGQKFADDGVPKGVQDRMRQLLAHLDQDRTAWQLASETLGRLQARLDQETDEFIDQMRSKNQAEQGRQATLFMQHAVERFVETVSGLLDPRLIRHGRPQIRAANADVMPIPHR
jgi:dipeptidase